MTSVDEPGQAEPGETEPDYRMSLALERTYLAHVRTGLALLAGGVALAGALPDAHAQGLRRGVALFLVASAGLLLATARRRFDAVDRAMRRGEPLPRALSVRLLAPALVVVAAAAVAVVLLV